jgi:hypothetical protein
MNLQEVLLSLNVSASSNLVIPYVMADETLAAIEFGDLTTQGTTSAKFIEFSNTTYGLFTIDSYGPTTITFNPSAINLPKKINRIVYRFSDGSPDIVKRFYYSPTSMETANYAYPLEPGDPRNFPVTKDFVTTQYFIKNNTVLIEIYQMGDEFPTIIEYNVNILPPEIDGNINSYFGEIHLVSTRMFGANNDILYIFESKDPNYTIPILLNWQKPASVPILTTNITPHIKRPYTLQQPFEIKNVNNDIQNIKLVKSNNLKYDKGAN